MALRELLEATLEWTGLSGPARGLTVEGVRYRLTPLTGGMGGVAVLCESQAGIPIPDYPARRRMRREMAGGSAPNLVIFTDSAHSALIWTWISRGDGGERVYRELPFRPGEAWGPLRPVLDSIGAGLTACSEPARLNGRDDSAPDHPPGMVEALAARIERGAGADILSHAQAVQDAIERAQAPDGVRDCWEQLLRSRVWDPRCGSGEWLEMALRALVPAYEACLERMLASIDDLRRHRPPPRRDRLGDFSRLTARAGGSRQPQARRRFATELALLHNLFGADPDPAAVSACRARLVGVLDGADPMPGPDLLVLNITVGESCPGTGAEGAEGGKLKDQVPIDGEIDVVRRAVATILRMHLDGAVRLDELSRALAAAAERLDGRGRCCIDRMAGAWPGPWAPAGYGPRALSARGLRLVRRTSAAEE